MRWGVLAMAACAVLFGQTTDPRQLFADAVAAQQRGDDALAIRDYQELIRQYPNVPQVRANLGAALAHAGRYGEAIEQYRAVLEQDSANAQVRLNLALAYYKKGDFTGAAAQLTTLHGESPGDTRVATLLGDCWTHMGRDGDTIALLTPIAQASSDDMTVAWILGEALIHAGNPRDGLPLVEKAAETNHSAEAWLLAGQTWLSLNEFEHADAAAAAALKLNPALPGLYTLAGEVKQYMGDYAAAKADLAKALAENHDDFDAHLTMAAILNADRDLEGAQRHVMEALRIRPSSTIARYELGRIARSKGDIEAAVRDFEQVVKQDPDWLKPHVELAALYYRVNRPADGEKERAIVDKLSAQPTRGDPPGAGRFTAQPPAP
jgi:tetratricopeptide (TPR) repeat protein